MLMTLARNWWILLLRGALATLFGILAFACAAYAGCPKKWSRSATIYSLQSTLCAELESADTFIC